MSYLEGGGSAWAVEQSSVVGRQSSDDSRQSPVVHLFSERFECRQCGIPYEDPQPRLFSFNNPYGACPTCHGFGNLIEVDLDLVVPDKVKSLSEGAIEPWSKPHYRGLQDDLRRFARRRGIPSSAPSSPLCKAQRRTLP